MKSFARPKLKVSPVKNKENTPLNVIKKEAQTPNEIIQTASKLHQDVAMDIEEVNCENNTKPYNENNVTDNQKELSTEISDIFDDDFDITQVENIETTSSLPNNDTESKMITEEQLLNGWETMQERSSNIEEKQVQVDVTQPPLVTTESGEKVCRIMFYRSDFKM